MTDKVLSKLSRKELLELLVAQSKENDTLRSALQEAQEQLDSRDIMLEEAGSIAEASLRINRVFEAAQEAAEQYLENARRLSQQAEEMLDQTRQRCALVIAKAQENAKKIEGGRNG